MARNPNTDVQWRPALGFATALALVFLTLVVITVIDRRLERRGGHALAALHTEQKNSAATITRLTKQLDVELQKSHVVDKRTRAIEKRLGPVLRTYRVADAQRTTLTSNVTSMRSELESWIEVPDIGVENETIAQSDVETAGLTWTSETVEGACSDYQDHFIDNGYGWSDVVKQDPAPGSRMPPDGSVTIYTWDYDSGWELGCTSGSGVDL